jgi:hypothetical protein
MESNTPTKNGRFSRGLELAKSSWRVLTLDKELITLPALSIIFSAVAVMIVVAIAIFITVIASNASGNSNFSSSAAWPFVVLAFCLYVVITVVANFFGGAVIYGATQRFRGQDPTVQSSISGAWKKFRPLFAFSLMLATVGLALQILEDRLPLAGKIVAWIGGAAWSIANVFAIPVIVLSDKSVRPLTATKESINIIRKVWGEGVSAQLGISLISLVGFLGYFVFWAFVAFVGSAIGNIPSVISGVAVFLAILGFIAMAIIFSTLTSIAKAALYHYATTGKAPEMFSKELLRTAMTPKKARRIFS